MTTKSLGDKLPSELLDHLEGLVSDLKTLQEVVLLDPLPANARVAALQHTDVRSMARAADTVVLENRAAAEFERSTVSSVSVVDDLPVFDNAVPVAQAAVAAVSRTPVRPPYKKTETLCAVHARYGREAYTCLTPESCKMHNVLRPRPPPKKPASGNGKAGGRQ